VPSGQNQETLINRQWWQDKNVDLETTERDSPEFCSSPAPLSPLLPKDPLPAREKTAISRTAKSQHGKSMKLSDQKRGDTK